MGDLLGRAEEMAEDVREFLLSSAGYADASKAEEEFRRWRRQRLERFTLNSADNGGGGGSGGGGDDAEG